MANISITHQKIGVDYVGGVPAANQTLFAADWNSVHFILSAGAGIQIVSDSGTPPTITFSSVGGAAGGGSSLSGGTLNAIPLWASSTTLTSSFVGQSGATVSVGATTTPSLDNVFDLGTSDLRWRNGSFAGTVSVGTLAYATLNPPVAGGGVSGGTLNAIPLWASATTLTNSIIGQMNATQVSVGGNIIPSASKANVATLGSLGSGFQKLYLANDNTGQIITQGGSITTDAVILPNSDQQTMLGSDALRIGIIKTTGLSNSSGLLSLGANGNVLNLNTVLDSLTAINVGTLYPSGDENLAIGTPSLRAFSMYFSRTISFGGAGQGTTGSLGYSSNTSVAMAFGGSATATGTVSGTARVIPVKINGATWYIQAFPAAS